MGYNHFYLNVSIRIILITITSLGFALFIRESDKIMASVLSALFIVIQMILLIKYINKVNRDLTYFLLRVRGGNTAVNYASEKMEKAFKGINLSFDKINQEIQRIKIENEQKNNFLHTVVNHVKIGIIAFDENGKIEIFNPEAQKIFKLNRIYKLSALNTIYEGMETMIKEIPLNRPTTLKIPFESGISHLSMKATKLKLGQKIISIVSMQDIKQELDEKELDSWQKLIRVLTHEIMNSITPITSLSGSIRRYLKTGGRIKKASEVNDEIISDILLNTKVIEDRGQGLMNFVQIYKNITQLPKLKIKEFNISALFQKIKNFYKPLFDEKGISLTISTTNNLCLSADESLIEQVLINLVKNAYEAMNDFGNCKIELFAGITDEQRTFIKITDNGKGIEQSELENIFIPFYSTKEQGSGIGLSLARQIMQMHNGNISVESVPEKGTSFSLLF